MRLGCGRTQIKAPLLSLYNNTNVSAVPCLRGLCVRAAGGSEVGPGEGLGTLGSDGGFGGRRRVLLGFHGWMMGMVQLMSRGAAATGTHLWGLTEPSEWEERGQRSRGGGAVLSLGGPQVLLVLLAWQERCCGVSLSTSRIPIFPSGDPGCPVGTGGPKNPGAEPLIGAWGRYLGFLRARSEMAGTCCSTAVGRGKCRPSSCSWPRG